uniref:Uncharacterized protein n=1 Tax=Anguilla anguilla TaxID=7936 RepID=A0A0E9S325_ANGAN
MTLPFLMFTPNPPFLCHCATLYMVHYMTGCLSELRLFNFFYYF